MAETKADLADSRTLSNQQAIVKQLIRKRNEPVRHVIPGGANLLENIDERTLKRAVKTWLNRVRWFDHVTINLVTDPDTRTYSEKKVEDFPEDIILAWDRADQGKDWLAGIMSKHLAETKVLSVIARKDGLYLRVPTGDSTIDPKDEDWEPHLLFGRRGKDEYAVF